MEDPVLDRDVTLQILGNISIFELFSTDIASLEESCIGRHISSKE